jgi:hypothetical protein
MVSTETGQLHIVHIAEECFAAGGFPAWASDLTRLQFTTTRFLAINAVALTAMTLASALVFARPAFRWLVATLGAIVALNGALHIVTSLITQSYSPGTVSGLVLWIPLGGLALRSARQWLSTRSFVAAVAVGVIAHGAVTAVAVLVSL